MINELPSPHPQHLVALFQSKREGGRSSFGSQIKQCPTNLCRLQSPSSDIPIFKLSIIYTLLCKTPKISSNKSNDGIHQKDLVRDTHQQWKNTKLNEKFNELLNCMMKIPDQTSLQIKKETLHHCALIILTVRFLTLFYRFPIFNTVEDEIYPLNLDNNPNPHIAIAKVVKKW